MASILDMYQNGKGTPLAYPNVTPRQPSNLGATKQSKLHNFYSINGENEQVVNAAYQAYNDGFNNTLPRPSLLDLNGKIPINSYSKNPPEKGISNRVIDLTPPPGR
jgi:hypothetical protein